MKIVIGFILLLIGTSGFTQFAIVSDKDGYTNIRSNAEANSKIIDTLRNDHFVFCFESKGNWTYIDYTKKDRQFTGYINGSRLRPISGFEKIPLLKTQSFYSILSKDSIRIVVKKKSF